MPFSRPSRWQRKALKKFARCLVALRKTIAVANPVIPEVNAIGRELEEFRNAILNNTRPVVSEIDGMMAMDVAHQILDKIGNNIITT